MQQSIKERLIEFIRYKGMTVREFEKKNNLSNGYVKGISMTIGSEKMKTIGLQYPELNKLWLLTGEGEMLNTPARDEDSNTAAHRSSEDYKLIPLIHIDSVGVMHSNNDIMNEPEYVEKYVPFLDACDGDKAIFQTGDSMIPTIPPGSIMQVRKVENWREYFGYGGIFVLLLTDGRRITKEVNRYDPDPANYVMCISHNPSVADEELPKSMIAGVWKVIKILTDRS